MKKYLISGSMAALSLLAMTSCSSEEEALMPSGDGVSFTINIPGNISTRGTFGDGTDAGDRAILDNLQWTVFEVGTDGMLTEVFSDSKDAFALNQNQEAVTINLAKGKTYQVAFYADDKDNRFATYANGNVSVNYDNAASNRASEDVFIGKSDVFTVEGSFNKTVTLTRPFAQLNWGTDDTAEQSIVPLIASLTGQVTISNGLYSKMNVVSGEVSEAVTTPVTFGAVNFNALPTNTFPVEKTDGTAPYALIAMNYLLTGDGTIDCELGLNNGLSAVTVNAAPVKVNYRTNIYGSLLTSPGTFNILVDNVFNIPDNNIEIVEATTPDEFVDAVNAGANILVPVDASIDLIGKGNIELVDNQYLKVEGTINTEREQISISGEGNIAYVEGPGKITSRGVSGARGNRPLNAYDGATLVVRNVEIETEQNNGGSSIYSDGGNLDLENVTVNSHHFGIGANGGTLKVKNCIINSDSNNREGSFSYTVSVADGCKAIFEGGEVNGIQGGITVQGAGAECVIKSGVYSTRVHPTYGNVAFYPVYATDRGLAIIEGGDFIGAANRNNLCDGTSCLVAGDNDVLMPDGNFVIKGGRFSGKAYNTTLNALCPLPEGYVYTPIVGGGDLKWTVTKTN